MNKKINAYMMAAMMAVVSPAIMGPVSYTHLTLPTIA